ncbi:MAG: hypothetical protein ACREPG_06100 [Candidatus Binatia bacterium]
MNRNMNKEFSPKGQSRSEVSPNGVHPLFHPEWYRSANPDLSAHLATFEHYLAEGWRSLKSPHPLFCVDYYLKNRPDVRRAGTEPLQHFVSQGWREGSNPCALFDVAFYLSQEPALHGLDPLTHFLVQGSSQGLKPNSDFNPVWYLETHLDAQETGEEALTHFVLYGQKEGRATCPGRLRQWNDRPAARSPEPRPGRRARQARRTRPTRPMKSL